MKPLPFALVCAAVLWMRTRHLDYLLPHLPEPDRYAVEQVHHLRARAAGSEEAPRFHFYFYPMLLARLHMALHEQPALADSAPDDDSSSPSRWVNSRSGFPDAKISNPALAAVIRAPNARGCKPSLPVSHPYPSGISMVPDRASRN